MISRKNSGGEKWGKSCTHSVRRARDTPSHHLTQFRTEEELFIGIATFLRGLCALREQRPPLREGSGERGGEPRGARWGARWGTPGSAVGNPGERGGEQGGEPRGARWGTPGSKVGSIVEQPGEQGGEHCGGTPSGSHNTTEQGVSGGSGGSSQPAIAFDI